MRWPCMPQPMGDRRGPEPRPEGPKKKNLLQLLEAKREQEGTGVEPQGEGVERSRQPAPAEDADDGAVVIADVIAWARS